MKHVKKSVLLCYSTHEMYALVTAVNDYPQFLPWCAKADVLAQTGHGMTARLTLAFSGIHHAFTTQNRHVEDRSVRMALIDGPFSRLDGHWQFLPLGAQGDATEPACKVQLDLRYAFASSTLAAVVSPVFDRVANTMVDSFVRRAEQVYGPR
jgi:ribosome-associated toxin RatA of RatAB toxin-antitoxin module